MANKLINPRALVFGLTLAFALPLAGGLGQIAPLDTTAEASGRVVERKVERKKVRRDRKVVVNKKRVVNRTVVVAPRYRRKNNVVIVRRHGHSYFGYGHHHTDNDAWKWLAFTAITLKILDNIDEASQRAHESAQIEATTAPIGEPIVWKTETASGSVVATKEGESLAGRTCREYQQQVTIGGETETAVGTACLQEDGSWKIVNS